MRALGSGGAGERIVRSRVSIVLAMIACLGGVRAFARQDETPTGVLKPLPIPGEVFLVDGHAAFLILPDREGEAGERPWVWYAPTLPGLPGAEERWMLERFLEAGIAVAGIDVGESYGSPQGRALYTSLYQRGSRWIPGWWSRAVSESLQSARSFGLLNGSPHCFDRHPRR